MLLENFLRNRKSQSRAARLARTRLIHAVEPVKQPRQILLRNANAVVRNADVDIFPGFSDMDLNSAAVRRIFHRVGYDIRDHLLYALAVAVDLGDVLLLGQQHRVMVILLGVELRRLIDRLHRLAE